MASLRELITARATVCLVGVTPAGSNVFRSREAAITRGMTPAIVVMPVDESMRRMGSYTDAHELKLAIEVFTRGDPWDQLADATAEIVHRVLVADPVIQSYQADVRRTTTDYESQEADRTAGVLTCLYTITYLAKAADVAANP